MGFIYLYFWMMRDDVRKFWRDLNDLLKVRLDKIPNLLVTISALTEGQEDYIKSLIKLRAESWPMKRANKEKVYVELEISEMLRLSWALADEFGALKHDINFLSLRTEFKDIGGEIENLAEEYNKRVRYYNRIIDFIVLKPILRLMRFGRLPIFEFEN